MNWQSKKGSNPNRANKRYKVNYNGVAKITFSRQTYCFNTIISSIHPTYFTYHTKPTPRIFLMQNTSALIPSEKNQVHT